MPTKRILKPFPGQSAPNIEIAVEVSRIGLEALRLWFVVSGEVDVIAKPGLAGPRREDGLWQHTCFEFFLKEEGQKGYSEVNLSPSGAWAAYQFDDYRTGMRNLPMEEPAISTAGIAGMWSIGADLQLAHLSTADWNAALSAVIEEKSGRKSYWALAHPAAKPDFHHPDSFVCELSPFSSPRT